MGDIKYVLNRVPVGMCGLDSFQVSKFEESA
jgi:hypothetical protein